MTPLSRMTNPDPMPGETRCEVPPPKNMLKTSTGTRSTVSVWIVTTAGATRDVASVMAVRREASTS